MYSMYLIAALRTPFCGEKWIDITYQTPRNKLSNINSNFLCSRRVQVVKALRAAGLREHRGLLRFLSIA